MIQSCADASPIKWHQARTTWFFETFVLRPFLKDYKPFREEFRWLFNSYYNSLGDDIPDKKLRASFSHPSLNEVVGFRAHVDQEVERFLGRPIDDEPLRRITLGLNHEQQHQGLALTDIKHAFFSNPLHPSYAAGSLSKEKDPAARKLEWNTFKGGLIEIGYSLRAENPLDFCFDNENPRHKVYLEPFQIRVAKIPTAWVARAVETAETRGFIKAIVDAQTKQILGAAVLSVEGGEIMSMLQIAMMGKVPYTALENGIFAHPAFAKGLNTLFMNIEKRACHPTYTARAPEILLIR